MTTKHHSPGCGHKGAIQMSLGMIVAVIFAVILLTSLIAWLSGMFEDITSITYEVTAIAKQNLIEDIETTGKVVGVAAPAVEDWARNKRGAITLAVENDNPNTLTTFYYHIYVENTLGLSNDVDHYFDTTSSWLTNAGTIDVPAGAVSTADIIISIPSNAETGTYQFRAAVCRGSPASNCHSASEHITGYDIASSDLYGSDQFGITVV